MCANDGRVTCISGWKETVNVLAIQTIALDTSLLLGIDLLW